MLSRYETMDVFMLLSICNMKLRDEGLTLSELCATYDLNEEILTKRLHEAGFDYDSNSNQFK